VAALFASLDEAKAAEVQAARMEHEFAHPGETSRSEMSEMRELQHLAAAMSEDVCEQSCMLSEVGSCASRRERGSAARGMGGGMKKRCAPQMMAMSAPGAPPPPPAMAMMSAAPPPPMAMKSAAPPPRAPPLPRPAQPQMPAAVEPPAAKEPYAPEGPLAEDAEAETALDYTRLPAALDAALGSLDVDAAVRPTTISVGSPWAKTSRAALLSAPRASSLDAKAQEAEKKRAFDLLDALSRSGSLPIACASLHVLLAATHCFDDALVATVVERNVNPVEKLEASSLILAQTIVGAPARELVRADQVERLIAHSAPALMAPPEESPIAE
jgi:hypothetical protein